MNKAGRLDSKNRIIKPTPTEQRRLSQPNSHHKFEHVHTNSGIRLLPTHRHQEHIDESCQWSSMSTRYSDLMNKHSSEAMTTTTTVSKGRCLRYKSDLQRTSSLWSYFYNFKLIFVLSIVLLLIIYWFYRRKRQSESEDDQGDNNERKSSLSSLTDEKEHPSLTLYPHPSEHHHYNVLATITEENPSTLTPTSSSANFNYSIKATSPPAPPPSPQPPPTTDETDSRFTLTIDSAPQLRQRKLPEEITSSTDADYVQISPNNFKNNENNNNSWEKVEKAETVDLSGLSSRIHSHQQQKQPFTVGVHAQFEDVATQALIEPDNSRPVIIRKFCAPHLNAIKDDYNTLEELNDAVEQVGLDKSQLIFGIDYTISNIETGKQSFNGRSLHDIQDGILNPYQSVITIIGRTLEKFDSDTLIPAFGFGDRTTLDRKIFPLRPDGSYCKGFMGVLDAYNKITPKVKMSGPTNFGPLIKEAIRIVKKTKQYHILVIVADGQVTNERQTKDAIVEASAYPLSIVMIGVGDGPWDMMEEFDDSLPTRQFDNFQFVNYNDILRVTEGNMDSDFALHALMEIPSQYEAIKKLGLLKNISSSSSQKS
ncbi:unnamed protein product [Didymodactylos carnosus]|uniref:VWFA domain-containing protein n=1 Tax=Didymodactylos carnosus TaxID=1234261 RepID=A0A813NYK2_9BILA|nr:unnamed protein product [Didymodactylos carnosus]CAF0922416.1 unnamed protein product [Didymodactylos carnosus]CAF3523365.1 unnamed protein product [Didymodactylos carnosus]CAF3699767.1 unnamed protein product [Didymodactylos carnosus]